MLLSVLSCRKWRNNVIWKHLKLLQMGKEQELGRAQEDLVVQELEEAVLGPDHSKPVLSIKDSWRIRPLAMELILLKLLHSRHLLVVLLTKLEVP